MKKASIKKILEHPDQQEIISKLAAGASTKTISAWLADKYGSEAEAKFLLTPDFLENFKDEYLDFYMHVKQDIIKIKDSDSLDKKLAKSVVNNKRYRERLQEYVDTEIDIKKKIVQLVNAIEARAEQVFDNIQDDPSAFKGDGILIQYFTLLMNALEKVNKIVNEAPDQVVQHKVTVQHVDQHINIFYDAIKEVLSELDYETSLHFISLFHEKLSALKAPEEAKSISADIRLAEVKLLADRVDSKLEP